MNYLYNNFPSIDLIYDLCFCKVTIIYLPGYFRNVSYHYSSTTTSALLCLVVNVIIVIISLVIVIID